MTGDQSAELEAMLTVFQVADALRLSRPTVIRLFENEPGVVCIDGTARAHKRRYRTLRIPRHVYDRVVQRLSIKPRGRG